MGSEPKRIAMIDPVKLKHDKHYNRAAIGGYLLAIMVTVAVGAATLPSVGWVERRGTAIYWLSMLPTAAWLIALAGFSRWAIMLLPFIVGGAPVVMAGLVLTHLPNERTELVVYSLAVAIAAVISVASLRWLKQSGVGASR
jgi:hypothetical protein